MMESPVSTTDKNNMNKPDSLSYGTVKVCRIMDNEHRLDASAYNMKAMRALSTVKHLCCGNVMLNSLIEKVFVGSRFKRIYTENPKDIPFFLPSDIENVYPKASKFISSKTNADIDSLRVKSNMMLMSCSGTIGKTSLVGRKLDNQVFSHDLLRITFKKEYDLGYVYAYLNTEIGLTILQSNNYGAVIDHIEPTHLQNIPIPDAPVEIRKLIHGFVVESFNLRDQSNELIDKAQFMLCQELQLPDLSEIESKQYMKNVGFDNYSVKVSKTNGRLDASYHKPEVDEIIKIISQNAKNVTILGDNQISKDIILPGRFKRIYVDKDYGIPFLGGKQLLSLSPSNIKYLSLAHHGKRIEEQLLLEENMCAVTCSGTIGKVMIIPKHWDGWTLNQHVIRIKPASLDIAGYIYAWLESDYCKPLITRYIYGAVVDEIDDLQIANVPIPILHNKNIQDEINRLVLRANNLRYKAYQKEQIAIKYINCILNGEIIDI